MKKNLLTALLVFLSVLLIANSALADTFLTATAGSYFSYRESFTGSDGNIMEATVSGLPAGMQFTYDNTGFTISGTPYDSGSYSISVYTIWSSGISFYNDYNMEVSAPADGIPVNGNAPLITKEPTGESVAEGGSCKFIARADDYETIQWYLTDGESIVQAYSAQKIFEGLTTSGTKSTTLKLENIPYSLNGWYAFARFENENGAVESAPAGITVIQVATPVPTAVPTATSTPFLTATPTSALPSQTEKANPVLFQSPEETVTPEPVHTHTYDPAVWNYDGNYHYHLCTCGTRTEMAAHTMIWETVREATKKSNGEEKGVCSICGYTATRQTQYTGSSSGNGFLVGTVIVLAVLLIAAVSLLVVTLKRNTRHRRR